MAEENIPKSFLDFLRNIDKVQIPRIQRDYVQGGKDATAKDIRDGFLDDLLSAVDNDSENLSLNFIYGMKMNQNKVFLPLDGQQRLTTLFLLHWYGAVTKLKDEERDGIIKILQKFSYQTRLSSKDFCHLLLNTKKIIAGMADLAAGTPSEKPSKPSRVITGDPGYSRFWRYDPTVDSMLNMLDAIHEKFKDVSKEKWRRLFEPGSLSVNFFAYELTDKQSPDDLYVKMNARGKHLTHFENVKAWLQRWMQQEVMDEEFQQQWKRNMDGEWGMFFWKREKSNLSAEGKPDPDPAKRRIDGPFWIFLNRVSLFAYFRNNPNVLKVLRNKEKAEDDDPEKDIFKQGKDFLDTLRFGYDKTTDYVSHKYHRAIFGDDDNNDNEHREFAYQLVSRTLNALVKLAGDGDALDALVRPKWPCENNNKNNKIPTTAAEFFWGRGRNISTWQNLLMIWAFAGYCQKFYDDVEKIDKDKLAHWMQFCFQVTDGVDAQVDVANAASLIIMCLGKMEDEADIHKFLGEKYEKYHEADKPLAQWHYGKTTNRAEIYNRFFDQKMPEVGKTSAEGGEKGLEFNAATILDEALKAYLRLRRQDGADWEDLLSKMEAHDRLHGRIQGIIGKNDDDRLLLENAKTRFVALNAGIRFSSNSEDFVTLVKYLKTPSLTLDFESSANWGQVAKNAEVAEAVCQVLLPPEKDPDELPEWAEILQAHPELITDAASENWGGKGGAHKLALYNRDGAYIFRKGSSGNIASGAIVLRREVHAGLKRLAGFNYPGLTMPDEFSGFYICKSPGGIGSEFLRIRLGAAQAEADDGQKPRHTVEKTVVIDSHNGIWSVVGDEKLTVAWSELAGYDSAARDVQAGIKARLEVIFAPPEPAQADRPSEAAPTP